MSVLLIASSGITPSLSFTQTTATQPNLHTTSDTTRTSLFGKEIFAESHKITQ